MFIFQTGDGSGTIALIANKFRTYKNCHSLEREAVEKESDISEERFRELLKERFGMVLPSEAKFIPGWEGSGYKTSFLSECFVLLPSSNAKY